MVAHPYVPLSRIFSQVRALMKDVSPSIVALKSFFSAPKNGELKVSAHIGAGVFIDRSLIVTSAHVIGAVSADRGSNLHNCSIGRTVAVTTQGELLITNLVAVSFGGDVAVLEAEPEEEGDLPPPLAVASSVASTELPLLAVTRHQNCNGDGILQLKFRKCEDNKGRTQWPYKIDDDLGWARYGGAQIKNHRIVPGSPWFSLEGQVVGMASWGVGNEEANSVGGFVVPPLRIRSVLDYAKGKAPHDPIVLDRWIDAPTFTDYGEVDLAKESFENVPTGFVGTLYL